MVNNNGFNLSDLVPQDANPASESPLRHSLPAVQETKPPAEIDVVTIDNPRALVNFFSEGYKANVLETFNKQEHEEARALYLLGDNGALERKVAPTRIDHALRSNLWTQYYRALETGSNRINVAAVVAGVTTQQTFERIVKSPRLFWLLLPPTDYTVANRRAHERGLDRLHSILEIDPVDHKTGKTNTALINLQIKIFALLDTRLNGPITHKHEITTKNVHLGITADQVQKLYQETQQQVEKLSEQDIVLRDSDIIEIQTHEPDYKR